MTADTDARLTDLEVKASYTDDLLDQLNQTIYRQQQQIDLRVREVMQLKRQRPAADQPMLRHAADDRPPHY